MPLYPTRLLGREDDLFRLEHLFLGGQARLVTVVGPGGVGKTRVAVAAAQALSGRFRDGAHFVELAPVDDVEHVPGAVARALGLDLPGNRAPLDALHAALRGRDILLVLDNFEHLLPAAPLVETLLSAGPRVRALLTGREATRLGTERIYSLEPLAVPGVAQDGDVAAAGACAAVQLFIERAQAVEPTFFLNLGNVRAVTGLCRRLDGLPLALELTAARARLLSPGAMLARLERQLTIPELPAGSRPARHRTLRAALDWSARLLEPPEREALETLGVFVGSFTLEAAEEVTGLGARTLDVLASLTDKHLVRGVGGTHDPRFSLLETIREYALTRLDQRGALQGVRSRHARHYLALAEQRSPDLHGDAEAEAAALLDEEHGNLRAALLWADEMDSTLLARLALALAPFWTLRGHEAEGRRWLERALSQADGDPLEVRARLWRAAGLAAMLQGDRSRARTALGTALHLQEELSDTLGQAAARLDLGLVERTAGHLREAAQQYEAAADLFVAASDPWGEVVCTVNLANTAVHRDFGPRMIARLVTALTVCEQRGHDSAVATVFENLGIIARHRGEPNLARAHHTAALALRRKLGDVTNAAFSLLRLGEVAADEGDLARAERLFSDSLGTLRARQGQQWVAGACAPLARLHARQGAHGRAAEVALDGLASAEATGGRGEAAQLLHVLALVLGAYEAWPLAAEVLGAAAAVQGDIELPLGPADQAAHTQVIREVRAHLDSADFAAAQARGQLVPFTGLSAWAHLLLDPAMRPAPGPTRAASPGVDTLSRRERDTLRLLAQGHTDKVIGRALGIAERTARHHVTSVLSKLGARTRAQAVALAGEQGLLDGNA